MKSKAVIKEVPKIGTKIRHAKVVLEESITLLGFPLGDMSAVEKVLKG